MKCSVEYTHVRDGSEQLPHLTNARDNHGIMEWRERIQLFHFRKELVSQQRSFCEFLAAMNDAMRHDTYFICATNDSRLLRSKFRDHRLESVRVVAFFKIALHFAFRSAMLYFRAIEADALNQAFGLARFVCRVVKRILQRGRTNVDYKNFSGLSPLSMSPYGSLPCWSAALAFSGSDIIVFVRSPIVREMCRTAFGSATMID